MKLLCCWWWHSDWFLGNFVQEQFAIIISGDCKTASPAIDKLGTGDGNVWKLFAVSEFDLKKRKLTFRGLARF